MSLKKVDETLWQQWQYHITAAGQIKREIDRRQNQPVFGQKTALKKQGVNNYGV
jgi:hypothetical protein